MSNDFDLEEFCGIEEYGTDSPGIGGRLKTKPEDFVVEEVPIDLEEGGNFLLCKLKKRNMTTFEAIDRISSKLRLSKKRIGYAGLKDKRACTTQFVTLEGLDGEEVKLDEEGLEVEAVKKVSRSLKNGDLKENRFTITLRGIDVGLEECRERLQELAEEIKEGVPNYYGLQRFGGKRPITHLVGKELLRRNYREAVETYLFKTFSTEKQEFREARSRLEENKNYDEALEYFPRPLTYERDLIKKLNGLNPSTDKDWIKVFKVFPKNLRRLFVHAYQSYVFNKAVSRLLRHDARNFPGKVPGYGTNFSSQSFDSYLEQALQEDNVKLKDFEFKDFGELSSKGTLRAVLIKPDFEVTEVKEVEGKATVEVSFSLKPGRYATVVMREIMKKSM
ncbi:MAG: tRNA pseudouridine(13) synthase TruD [Candidatus Aenigmatarchaeota archaeon]